MSDFDDILNADARAFRSDWFAVSVFQPALYDGVSYTSLPGVIISIRVGEPWDFERYKVPLKSGDVTTGLTPNGVDIEIRARIASETETDITLDVFAEIETLRQTLHGMLDGQFDFYLHHNELSNRYFQNCSVVRLDYDASDPSLLAYILKLHADDPVIYGADEY